METPNELHLRKLILAIPLPFRTGNKICLYLHFSLIHSMLPLFGNPSHLFFFSKSISWPFKWKQLNFLQALPGFKFE